MELMKNISKRGQRIFQKRIPIPKRRLKDLKVEVRRDILLWTTLWSCIQKKVLILPLILLLHLSIDQFLDNLHKQNMIKRIRKNLSRRPSLEITDRYQVDLQHPPNKSLVDQ